MLRDFFVIKLAINKNIRLRCELLFNMKFTILLLCAALVGSAVSRHVKKVPVNPRIVNGQEAVPHSLPYQVFLDFKGDWGEEWFCGGALISENYVLTAGHCTQNSRSVEVTLGAHSLKNSEETKQIFQSPAKNIISHEDFDYDEVANDIGLVKLPHTANLTAAVAVIELSTLGDQELVGKLATVSGWGLTNAYVENGPDTLRVVNVTIVEDSVCKQWGNYNNEEQVCTNGPENRGPCEGDSGGPLAVEGKLAGLVSYGPSNCKILDGPDAYTRVSNYLEWIKKNTDVKIE